MSSGDGIGSASSSQAETATLPLTQRNARSAAALLRKAASASGDTAGFSAIGRSMFRMVFDYDCPARVKDGRWRGGSNQATRLFLGGRALQKNAGFPGDQPVVALSRLEVRFMILLLGAEDEPAVCGHGLGPDQRIPPYFRSAMELRFTAVPDKRPGADGIAPISQPVRHGQQALDEGDLLVGARQQPWLGWIGLKGKAAGFRDPQVPGTTRHRFENLEGPGGRSAAIGGEESFLQHVLENPLADGDQVHRDRWGLAAEKGCAGS